MSHRCSSYRGRLCLVGDIGPAGHWVLQFTSVVWMYRRRAWTCFQKLELSITTLVVCFVVCLWFKKSLFLQTVRTQIRLLLEEQSDLGSHCLPVCKNRFETFARIFSRRHKQTTFSDAGFLGASRVKCLKRCVLAKGEYFEGNQTKNINSYF